MRPLLDEAGGHRWQRVPPTEKRGRVHTSTVTVSVMEMLPVQKFSLADRDIRVETTRDTGPGGQHRNTTDSCVVMTHIPTGIKAKAAARSQHENRRTARELLEARVAEHFHATQNHAVNHLRKAQVGSGMRGDKIRTYREKDDTVTDHRSGRKCRLTDILDGKLEALHTI